MNCRLKTSAWALWLVSLIVGDVSRGDETLRWKLTPGQKLRMEVVQHTATETTGAGKATAITLDMRMEMTWQVEPNGETGKVRIRQQFDRLTLAMKTGQGEPIEFDSAQEQPPASVADIAATLQPLMGVGFFVTMTDRGAVSKVELSPEAEAALTAVKQPVLQNLLSPAGLTKLWAEAGVEFPETPLAAGTTWQSSAELESALGKLRQQREFTYAGMDVLESRELSKIVTTSTLTAAEDPEAANRNRSKLVSQQQSGVLWFDNQAGRLERSESTQELVTERPYREFRIRVRATTTSTIRLSAAE